MGYRSDVRCLIYGEPDIVQAFWAKHKLNGNLAFKDWEDNIDRYELDYGDGYSVIDFGCESWEWDDVYPHVAAWNDLLTDIEQETECTTTLAYEFARIGEDSDDMEYRGWGDSQYFLSIRREIDTNMPPKLKGKTNEQDAESQG